MVVSPKSFDYWFGLIHSGLNHQYMCHIGTNLWRGGSVIIPLTPDEAKAWCEEQITYEE